MQWLENHVISSRNVASDWVNVFLSPVFHQSQANYTPLGPSVEHTFHAKYNDQLIAIGVFDPSRLKKKNPGKVWNGITGPRPNR